MMNKFLTAGAVFIGLAAEPAKANHPFVGQYADKNQIEREDGAVTSKLTATSGHLDKYNAFISKDFNFRKQSSVADSVKELVFGKDASQTLFDRRVSHWLSQKKSQSS